MSHVHVCIRLDDYDNSTPLEVVRALAAILEKRNQVCLFGIIPYTPTRDQSGQTVLQPLSGEPAEELRQLVERGTVIPALHGFSHQRGKNGEAEFECGSMAEQSEKISAGKQLLERLGGKRINGFVPPWNGVSDVTEKALIAQGFDYVSTSIELGTTSLWQLADFPSTAFWKSRNAILNAIPHLEKCPLVVLTGHFFDFHHPSGDFKQEALQEFDSMLGWLDSQPEVRVIGMDEALDVCRRHPVRWKSIRRATWAFGLPYRIRMSLRWPNWIPTKQISFQLRMIQAIGFTFWASIILLSWLVGWFITQPWGSYLPRPGLSGALLCILAGALAACGTMRNLTWGGTRVLFVGAAGCTCGIACALLWA